MATRALRPWIRRSWWPRSGTLPAISGDGVMRSDTRPVGGLLELADWTVVVDGWFNWPRSAITADLTVGGGAAVVVNWRPSSPARHNPTTVTLLRDGTVDAEVATDGWPGWLGHGADVGRFAAAAAGMPRADVDPRAVALTVAGRLTAAPVDSTLLTTRLQRVNLRER